MFQNFISSLEKVQRFDRVAKSTELEFGEVGTGDGKGELALRVPSGEAFTLEERGAHQLLAQWGIPADHFERLSRPLQIAELRYFAERQPRTLTLRATGELDGEHPAIRSVMSSRYTPFDNVDVLRVIEPYLERFDLSRSSVTRDEMVLALTLREEHDVSLRRTGDVVKAGLTLRNSEVGTMSLGVDVSAWRLVCLNGLILPSSRVSISQRHIWIDRRGFEKQLLTAIEGIADLGRGVVDRLRASHSLHLPNLDPDDGKLQASVTRILRREGVWNQTFRTEAEIALGSEEEASLFGLVQFMTGRFAKDAPEDVRLNRERAAGRLLSLTA